MNYENAEIKNALHSTPPYLLATIQGNRFKILLNSATFLLLGNNIEFPIEVCPISMTRIARAHVQYWMIRNRSWWPVIFFITAALVVLNMVILASDESAEARLSFIARFSMVMNTTLYILICLCAVSAAMWKFGSAVSIKWGDEPDALLGPGKISISPDIFIVSESENESPVEFAKRLQDAKNAQQTGQWIVAIPFRGPALVIVRNKEQDEEANEIAFRRDEPPYEGADWPDENRTAKFGTRFDHETFGQYLEYLNRFAIHYPEWAKYAKLKHGVPTDALANMLKRAAGVVALILFFTAGIVAQKDVQVRGYLGDYRYNNDRPNGVVKFIFQKAVIARDAAGKTYRDLAHTFYSNEDDAGRLIGITVAGQVINPETPGQKQQVKKAEAESAGELQPISETSEPRKGFWQSLPDSSRLQQMKAEFIRQKVGFGKELAPRQDFVFWFYWQFIAPILLFIGIGAWYVCKSAYSDSAYNQDGFSLFGRSIAQFGHTARYIVFFVMVVNTLAFIIDMAIADYFASTNMWWWLIKSFLAAVVAWLFTQLVVPNPKVKSTQGYQGNGYSRLNG